MANLGKILVKLLLHITFLLLLEISLSKLWKQKKQNANNEWPKNGEFKYHHSILPL